MAIIELEQDELDTNPFALTEMNNQLQQGEVGLPQDYHTMDILSAAIGQESVSYALVNNFLDPDPENTLQENYNVMEDIEGYEGNIESFIGVRNPHLAGKIKTRIDDERYNRKVLESGGVTSFGAYAVVGLLDPISLGLNIASGGLGLVKTGGSILYSAARVGALTAATTAVEEGVLQVQQETRTSAESGTAIAAGAFLGGLIGGGAQKFVNTRTGNTGVLGFNESADDVADSIMDVQDLTMSPNREFTEFTPEFDFINSKIRTDDNELHLNLWGKAINSGGKYITPVARLSNSPLSTVRTVNSVLNENAFVTKGNSKGVASYQSIELKSNMEKDIAVNKNKNALQDNFSKSGITDYDEFNERVGIAMHNSDKDLITALNPTENTYVSQAAKAIRSNLYTPVKDRYTRVGLFKDNITPVNAESYMTVNYIPEVINQKHTEVKELFTKYGIGNHNDMIPEFQKLLPKAVADFETNSLLFETAKDYLALLSKNLTPEQSEEAFNKILKKFERLPQATSVGDGSLKSNLRGIFDGETSPEILKMERLSSQVKDLDSLRNYLVKNIDKSDLTRAISTKGMDGNGFEKYLKQATKEMAPEVNNMRFKLQQAENGSRPLSEADVDKIHESLIMTMTRNAGYLEPNKIPQDVLIKAPYLQHRGLNIPVNEMSELGIIENNAEHVAAKYANKAFSDLQFRETFGNNGFADMIDAIDEEAQEILSTLTTGKERDALLKTVAQNKKDLALAKDRILGEDGRGIDPVAAATVWTKNIKSINAITQLGGVAVTAIPDVGKMVMADGFGPVLKQLSNYLTKNGREYAKASRSELREMGIGLEFATSARANSMADLNEAAIGKKSKSLDKVTEKFFTFTGMNHMNDYTKSAVAAITMNKILRIGVDLVNNKGVSKNKLTTLASLGIDEAMAKRIGREFDKHGEKYSNGLGSKTWLANTSAWNDIEAGNTLSRALHREANASIVTAGNGDKPRFATNGRLASLMWQYKTFTVASINRTLMVGAGRADANTVKGLGTMLALGGFTYYLKEIIRGKSPDEIDMSADAILFESIDASGIVPFYRDVSALTSATGITGTPSRYEQRNNALNVLGPTGSRLLDIQTLGSQLIDGDLKQSGFNAIRNSIPYQNHALIRGIVRQTGVGNEIQEVVTGEPFVPYKPK